MKNYCASCGDALFYSEGTRLNPLNYFSACRYLSDNEETDKMYLDENERYSLASDLAADICSMCCDKHIDLLMAFDHDEDNEETYQLIAEMYERFEENVPLVYRAIAAVSEEWCEFMHMVMDEVEVNLEFSEFREEEDQDLLN